MSDYENDRDNNYDYNNCYPTKIECPVCRKNYLSQNEFDSSYTCLECGLMVSKEELWKNFEFVLMPDPELLQIKNNRSESD